MTETKTCPFCAEEIKGGAIKCKHCYSMLHEVGRPAKAINREEKPTVTGGQIAGWLLVSILFPIIGFVAGIYYLAKGYENWEIVLGGSLFFGGLWLWILF